MSILDVPIRLRSRIETVPESGCWIWTGGARRSGKGHGRFWHSGRHVFAYRWSYEHFHGPIPEGCRIYHLCDVQECVNPDHLQIAEPLDNSMDAIVDRIKSRCIPITESGSSSGRCAYPMPDWLKRSVLRGATNRLDDVQYTHWGTDCTCFERKEMGHE